MGQKDITEKMLADYNDVFADIVNVLLFDGKQVIGADSLENVKDKSQYKAASQIHEEERDVSKVFKRHNIRIAMLGLEHQTNVDADEVFRVLGYDGASYRSQLLNGQRERYPVVTLVFYFGTKRWNKATSLFDALEISDEWKPFVNNYKINLFEIAFLEPEQVAKFKSDFRIVADYFVQMRTNNDYQPSKETFIHVDEVLKLLSVLTDDSRFEESQNYLGKGGATNMCEVLDRAEARGEARGEIKGMVIAFNKAGFSAEQIANEVGISVEEVQNILASHVSS
ncbi:MAG: Rpn family recombination-promoting nuclease/putative transposase [Lachnospiraceae bacterium]|nr:Rpn family recombination-promoting nuclease/putative transposase [Lachnospiraceae bacterium]